MILEFLFMLNRLNRESVHEYKCIEMIDSSDETKKVLEEYILCAVSFNVQNGCCIFPKWIKFGQVCGGCIFGACLCTTIGCSPSERYLFEMCQGVFQLITICIEIVYLVLI